MTLSPAHREAKDFCIAIQDAVGPNHRNDLSSEDAALHLIEGKPAYGWTTSYSNAPAGTFAATVNALGGIEAAQDDLKAHFTRNGRDVTDECWLDNLLPLNRAAVMDLMVAYQRSGSFREAAELEKRTARYLSARVDERPLVASVAAAIGVPALQAAE